MKTTLIMPIALFLMIATVVTNASYLDNIDPNRPFMLSRLPYQIGPVRTASSFQLDDLWNVQVNSDTTQQIQNEEQLAINPLATNNLVAVWRDFRYGYRRVGYAISSDHGMTWTDELYPQYLYPWQSDPGITFNRDGHFFTVILTFDPDPGGEDALIIVESDDNGQTWGDPVIVVDAVADRFEDKQLMACDRTLGASNSNLYVSWTPFFGDGSTDSTHIMVACSRDSGQSFVDDQIISDNTGVQWSVPAVGANGEVYVAWVDYYPGSITMDRSFDYGVTWGNDIVVQEVEFVSGNINGDLRTFSFPAMDVDIFNTPWRGRIYMAYAEYRVGGDDLDLFMTMSDDHGDSWSTPMRLNDDPVGPFVDQFHPWTTVDTSGVVTVVFYDRRNDPSNLLMDLYFTQSADGGTSWTPNQRITTVSSDPTAGSRAGLIGEYIGLISWDGIPHTVWTDTRNGNQDVFAAALDTTIVDVPISHHQPPVPTTITLDAYPNPFNPATSLQFSIDRQSEVTLTIYNIQGQRVATVWNGMASAGTHHITFNGDDLPSGIYFAHLTAGTNSTSHKMVLMK